MRFVASTLIAVMFWSAVAGVIPAPARAMSTAAEIELGKQENAQVDAQSVIVTDPFLTHWVEGTGANLAKYRARTDIDYHFEIIDSNEINSFAMAGGFIHVDMGLLNFVSSDDELASVMGHEMGHVERRHVVTLNQKGNLLSILVGVLSILSPIGYFLGGYGGDLAFYKFSRQDELQADQYGLMLMTRAGYDPQSNVDVLSKLAGLEGSANTDKYFADHPGAKDRVAHVLGYPELDRPSAPQLASEALHDTDEGRYSYALSKFDRVLSLAPQNTLAGSGKTDMLAALRSDGKGAVPAQLVPSPVVGAQGDPAIAAAAANLSAAMAVNGANIALVKDRSASAGREIEDFVRQLNALAGSVPNLGQPKVKGNNLSKATDGLDRLNRDVNGTIDQTSDVISTTDGLLGDINGTLGDLAGPLRDGPLSSTNRTLLPLYPSATAALAASSDRLVSAVDAARGAVSTAGDAVQSLADYLAALNKIVTSNGDIAAKDMPGVQAALDKALAAWDNAKSMADHASNMMYTAQSRQLSARLDLLDLYSSAQRYASYRKAMMFRFPGVEIPSYTDAQALNVTPGELGMAAWLSFETKTPVVALIRQAQTDGTSCADLALQRSLFGESLE
ncbi:MAG TPA: M48 family metalloprotease, partial [Candidatus Eremiobacteraceae bacterium]|nr:M48 family metalloprotease [Candidatus Eremiobacteraceae bacterium]